MRYQIDEDVLFIKTNRSAKIIQIDEKKELYKIQFYNPIVHPSCIFVKESEIERLDRGRCSKCFNPWNISYAPVSGDKWIDCKTCNKTKEQIEKEKFKSMKYG